MDDFDALRADDGDLAELRADVRRFLAEDAAQFGWRPGVDCWLSKWDADFSMRLAAAGFVGLTIPVEYGGHGRSHMHRYVVTEELLAHGAPVAAHWIADRQVAPALLTYGSEDQRRRLLPRIASGTLYSAIGMSEHEAGSDLAAVTTKATRTDTGWLLSGSKVWTSGAHLADQIVVLARTSPIDPDHRHSGFSQFIVPTSAPGVTIDPIIQMSGEHHFNEVLFDDVALSDADLLGEVGAGWHQVTSELGFERSGPERFLSTATLLFTAIDALRDRPEARADVGRLLAQLISLRQLSASVARDLTAGHDAAARAALVKDLGTGFEQDSVEIVADLLDRYDIAQPQLTAMLDTARVHSPLFTLRGGTNEVLRGIVAKGATKLAGTQSISDDTELRELADQIGRRAADPRTLPSAVDEALWQHLESAGLTRLCSDDDAGPAASATVLHTLARHAAAVPLAETDVLASWLATATGLTVPASGPLTVTVSHQAGEPSATIGFDSGECTAKLTSELADELNIRGAWARCIQIVGALDAAADSTISHITTRIQFGRALSAFQAVQHALASMLGEIERARAATQLAVSAADQFGFADPRTRYAVAAAKVTVGRAVAPVTRIAHQLHGAIGTTAEHPLWRATIQARTWADEFGSVGSHAAALGELSAATSPWDATVGRL